MRKPHICAYIRGISEYGEIRHLIERHCGNKNKWNIFLSNIYREDYYIDSFVVIPDGMIFRFRMSNFRKKNFFSQFFDPKIQSRSYKASKMQKQP